MDSSELFPLLGNLFEILGRLLVLFLQAVLSWSLLLAWIAWWLWAVDWRKVWPVLAQGAWVAIVLVLVVSALVWSQLDPGEANFLGLILSNFWWQLGGVILLAALALFCGWLQGVLGWAPPEINFEPAPAASHDGAHAYD